MHPGAAEAGGGQLSLQNFDEGCSVQVENV